MGLCYVHCPAFSFSFRRSSFCSPQRPFVTLPPSTSADVQMQPHPRTRLESGNQGSQRSRGVGAAVRSELGDLMAFLSRPGGALEVKWSKVALSQV